MTRSQFFKKLGLGALVCAVAPKMLAERPKVKVYVDGHLLEGVTNIKINFNEDLYGKPPYLDAIKAMQEQLRLVHYTPDVCFMNVNGSVINVLDPKNKKIVNEYLKMQ